MQSIWSYIQNNYDSIIELTIQHIEIAFISVFVALLIGVPFGILFTRHKITAAIGLNIFTIIYTIPSLALLGLMIPIVGMGTKTAIIALIIYSLMPIVQNAYSGIKNIDQTVIEAARGMGMSSKRILFKIELPLATSVILAGLRTALVNSIGVTAIASYIGAGGLGVLVFRGISSVSTDLILIGSIPIILLAIISDYLLKLLEKRFTVTVSL